MSKVDELVKQMGLTRYDGSATKKSHLYHPIPFEDYSHIKVHKTNCYEEVEMVIKDWGSFKNTRVLDIGAAGGFFTFTFWKEGADVVSYEADPICSKILSEVRKEQKIEGVNIVPTHFDLEIASSYPTDSFDVTLMLNVHQWIDKQNGRDITKAIMKEVSRITKHALYFQTATTEASALYKVPYLKSKEDVQKYLELFFPDVKLLKTTTHNKAPRHFFVAKKDNERNQ